MDPDGREGVREVEGIERGETLVRIYYARERVYFQEKGKSSIAARKQEHVLGISRVFPGYSME